MQLICHFVFAYAKSRFSHGAAHMAKTGFLMKRFSLLLGIMDIFNCFVYVDNK